MGSAERRQRHREELRSRILEAALEIVSEQGLTALSIRAIAERIEYSSATIYLHFQSKEALVQEVAQEGFRRFDAYMQGAVASLPPACEPLQEMRALGRAYVQFALENTAYFRVMYDLPAGARLEGCRPSGHLPDPVIRERNWARMIDAVRDVQEDSPLDPEHTAIAAWALLHGMVSLYLSGHLQMVAPTLETFDALLDGAMTLFRQALGDRRPALRNAG